MVPSNVECLATYIHPDTDIQETVIHFKPSVTSGLLLTVPIETPDCAIVVTLSTNSSHLDKYDTWLKIRIRNSDNKENSFCMFDAPFYEFHPPCYPGETVSADDPLVSKGTKATSTFKFTFIPSETLGICETAQDDGYKNVGKFSTQLNLNEPLYLELESKHREVDVYINYIAVELM